MTPIEERWKFRVFMADGRCIESNGYDTERRARIAAQDFAYYVDASNKHLLWLDTFNQWFPRSEIAAISTGGIVRIQIVCIYGGVHYDRS